MMRSGKAVAGPAAMLAPHDVELWPADAGHQPLARLALRDAEIQASIECPDAGARQGQGELRGGG